VLAVVGAAVASWSTTVSVVESMEPCCACPLVGVVIIDYTVCAEGALGGESWSTRRLVPSIYKANSEAKRHGSNKVQDNCFDTPPQRSFVLSVITVCNSKKRQPTRAFEAVHGGKPELRGCATDITT
jgi:hypothetical protein